MVSQPIKWLLSLSIYRVLHGGGRTIEEIIRSMTHD